MRAPWVLVACCACGRVAFDARGDASIVDGGDATDVDPSLQLWLPLDGPCVSNIVDSSRFALAIACQLGKTPTSVAGVRGDAYLFDGVGDYLSIPWNPRFQLDEGTVALWTRLDALPDASGYRFAIGKPYDATTDKNTWEFFATDNDLGGGGDSVTGIYWTKPHSMSWTHAALTWSSGTASVYVDGALLATGTLPMLWDSQDISVGADVDYGSPSHFWQGALDDVRIYDRVLSAQEISELATP